MNLKMDSAILSRERYSKLLGVYSILKSGCCSSYSISITMGDCHPENFEIAQCAQQIQYNYTQTVIHFEDLATTLEKIFEVVWNFPHITGF